MMCQLVVVLLAAGLSGGPAAKTQPALQRAAANDNRTPAGGMERDTLVLRLTVTPAQKEIYDIAVGLLDVLEYLHGREVDVGQSTTIKYDFEVGGISYRGYMQQPREMARYWSASDTVPILYDPEDPSQSCIVHR